jgi:small GTP-binding protein
VHLCSLQKTVVLVGNNWEKSLVKRQNVSDDEARQVADRSGALYAHASCAPELRGEVVRMLDTSLRYVIYDVTKKESLLASVSSCLINSTKIEASVRERLVVSLLASSQSVDNHSAEESASPLKKGLLNKLSKAHSLVQAVQKGNVAQVRSVLASLPKSSSKSAALLASVAQRPIDNDVVSAVIDAAPADDLDVENSSGETALYVLLKNPALSAGSMILAKQMLDKWQLPSASTAFHVACERGHTEFLRIQERNLPDCAFQLSSRLETPAYICARLGHHEALKILVADPRILTHLQCTSAQFSMLHAAVLGGHMSCITVMLESPVTDLVPRIINAQNKEGYTPLALAIETEKKDFEMRNALLNSGADIRVGRVARQAPQLLASVFVPAFLAWNARVNCTYLDLSKCLLETLPAPVLNMKRLQKLDLSRNRLEVIPRQISDLSELKELFLNDNMLRSVAPEMLQLTMLRALRLDGNAKLPADLGPLMLSCITKNPTIDVSGLCLQTVDEPALASCAHAEELALNNNSLSDLRFVPSCKLDALSRLWAHENNISEFPTALASAQRLELLKLSDNRIAALPAGMEPFPMLRELWLERNRIRTFSLRFLTAVPGLKRLWLDENDCASITMDHDGEALLTPRGGGDGGREVSSMAPSAAAAQYSLVCLSLNRNKLHEIPSFLPLVFAGSLKRLWLDGNLISALPASFGQLSNLETLSLNQNPLQSFPSQVVSLVNLIELSLNDCLLQEIDPTIGNLTMLKKFSLRNNRLRFLPQTIGHLTRLTLLDVAGNAELTSPPPGTVANGTQAMVGFLRDLIVDSKPSYRMKLMIVGQEAVGKSSLLRELVGKKKRQGPFGSASGKRFQKNLLSTDGIDIEQWNRKIKDPKTGQTIKVNFRAWDFAGQEVYYSTHSFFLSNRSIYLVVWSLKLSEDEQRVPYWLQSIQARAPKAPIMLVGTHAEGLQADFLHDYGRRVTQKYQEQFPSLSIISFTGISPVAGLGLKTLLEKLDIATLNQPFMGEPLPTVYLTLEDAVFSERKRVPPVMQWEDFRKLGSSCNLLHEDELLRATALLHEMGSLFCFQQVAKFIVLDPQWLTKMMSQLITTKKSFVKNGVLEHKDIAQMWRAPDYPPQLHRHLLFLLQSFDILFRMDSDSDISQGKSLVPVMLPPYASDGGANVVRSWEQHRVRLGRLFDFDFVPAGFFARLTVRLLHLADRKLHVFSDLVAITRGSAVAVVSLMGVRIQVMVYADAVSPDTLNLLKSAVQNLESLAEDWFQIRTTTRIPCVHCMNNKEKGGNFYVRADNIENNDNNNNNNNRVGAQPYLFDLQECEQAAAQGRAYVSCSGQYPVALSLLCPDVLVSPEIPVVPWDALHDLSQVGVGTFAYVYRARMQTAAAANGAAAQQLSMTASSLSKS